MNTPSKRRMPALLALALGTVALATGRADPPPAPGAPGGLAAVPGPAPALAATNGAAAKIRFDKEVYDFGRVLGGEQVKHSFFFTNVGVDDLVLNSVRGSCSCTVVGNWARQVKPGAYGEIPVVLNTANGRGGLPLSKTVTVACNDRSRPGGVFTLYLKGSTWRPVEVTPPTLAPVITPDSLYASASAHITNALEELMVLSAPQCDNPRFSAFLTTNVFGKDYTLTVSNSAPLPAGGAHGVISMKTSLTNPAVVNVSIYARSQPPVNISPPSVLLRRSPLLTNQVNYVVIVNNSTNPMTLSEPSVDPKGVDIAVAHDPRGRRFTVTLKFPPGFELAPGQTAAFTAKTSLPQMPLIKVPITQVRQTAARPMAPRRPRPLVPFSNPALGQPPGSPAGAGAPPAPPPTPPTSGAS